MTISFLVPRAWVAWRLAFSMMSLGLIWSFKATFDITAAWCFRIQWCPLYITLPVTQAQAVATCHSAGLKWRNWPGHAAQQWQPQWQTSFILTATSTPWQPSFRKAPVSGPMITGWVMASTFTLCFGICPFIWKLHFLQDLFPSVLWSCYPLEEEGKKRGVIFSFEY